MTPAEFKTLRESLALTVRFVCERMNVQQRTAQYWESGGFNAPHDAVNMLRGIDSMIDNTVSAALSVIENKNRQLGEYPKNVRLIRYKTDDELWEFVEGFSGLPASTHAVMLNRLSRELKKMNIKTRIIYMNKEDYSNWLCGNSDSEEMRAKWAVSLKINE